jgi:hypothetical protein
MAEDAAKIMDSALTEICNWPDGGNRYGQGNIKRFAEEKLNEARRIRFNNPSAHAPAEQHRALSGEPCASAAPNFCENCAMDLDTCDCVEPKPIVALDIHYWKNRALEAEELNRKFMASVNGPTHMGEPVIAPILTRAHRDSIEVALQILGNARDGDLDFYGKLDGAISGLDALLSTLNGGKHE